LPERWPGDWRGMTPRGTFLAGVVTGAALMFGLAVLVGQWLLPHGP
jgi:hypothetical protein